MKLLVFFIFLSLLGTLQGETFEQPLKKISRHEKKCMREFFDYAIKMDQAAHVLCFDNKPVCFTGVVVKSKGCRFNQKLALKGWIAFKRHEHLFPHPRFIFSEEMFEDENFQILKIYLINKKALHKKLSEHSLLFQSVLGDEFSPVAFIDQLEMGEPLHSLINSDEMLLGILLGYGVESSKDYQQKSETTNPSEYCPIHIPKPKGCTIYPLGFMGNPHSLEVQKIISSYEKEYQLIWSLYKQYQDPLLMALHLLCHNKSPFQQ